MSDANEEDRYLGQDEGYRAYWNTPQSDRKIVLGLTAAAFAENIAVAAAYHRLGKHASVPHEKPPTTLDKALHTAGDMGIAFGAQVALGAALLGAWALKRKGDRKQPGA